MILSIVILSPVAYPDTNSTSMDFAPEAEYGFWDIGMEYIYIPGEWTLLGAYTSMQFPAATSVTWGFLGGVGSGFRSSYSYLGIGLAVSGALYADLLAISTSTYDGIVAGLGLRLSVAHVLVLQITVRGEDTENYFISIGAGLNLAGFFYPEDHAISDTVSSHPTAKFSYLPEEPTVGTSVLFDASASTCEGCTGSSYRWDFDDGSFSNGKQVHHTFTDSRWYNVKLTVTDAQGISVDTRHYVHVASEVVRKNVPPIAKFSYSPSHPKVGEQVTFDASKSSDPDGKITSYKWDYGGSEPIFGKKISIIYPKKGVFTITLDVVDNDGATASASETIIIAASNKPPEARFTSYVLSASGARLTVQPKTGDRVRFDASSSTDSDGTIVKYEWDWDSDGTFDASPSPMIDHTFTVAGSHQVTLRVTDDKGAIATTTRFVTVGNKQPPQAAFTYLPATPSVVDTVHFTDSSIDTDGQVTKWYWRFGDGSTSTERNPMHKYTQKRTYTVTLTVTDNDGLTDMATQTLAVVNLAPTGAFTFSPQWPVVNQPISFDASVSQDEDGTITDYSWDFGDESSATGKTASHTFTEKGTYTVKLVVTDDDGATASHQEQITVKATPPGPPRFKNEWGLVVGIADYEDPSLNDLKFTENDAQCFYNFLVDLNGSGFPKDHVQFLLGQQATGQAMRGGFKWLIDNAEKDDLVVIYYAGHGGTGPDYNHDEQDGFDEYLVPYDAQASDLFTTAIRDDEIGDWLTSIQCTHILLVFDSCFSGGATRKVRSFNTEGMRAGPGNQVFTDLTGEGRLVLAASQEDEPSYEDPPLKHGVFTYFLLQGLGVSEDPDHSAKTTPKADTNEDGRVTVEELQTYLNQEVPQYIKDVMHEKPQHPLISGDTTLRDIVWNGYGVPLTGEVTSIQGNTIIISLGSRQGIQHGDRFKVIRPLPAPGGTIDELEAIIEVQYILGPDRAGCKVVKPEFPVQVHDQVQPVNETGN